MIQFEYEGVFVVLKLKRWFHNYMVFVYGYKFYTTKVFPFRKQTPFFLLLFVPKHKHTNKPNYKLHTILISAYVFILVD